jgi:hypothetical protein
MQLLVDKKQRTGSEQRRGCVAFWPVAGASLHDLNMHLDPGFRAVFACWLHVFSEAEFWIIQVHSQVVPST